MPTQLQPIFLTINQRLDFLARLRDARAQILKDSESFREASTVLEHIGQVISGKIGTGLKDHESAIVKLAAESNQADQKSISRLFNVVREARNKAVHDGAYARHLNTRLVELLLLLEDAITINMERVEDLMVRNPVIAEPWHLIAHVRKSMLANSFSTLPIFYGKADKAKWMLLRDSALMHWIRSEPNKKNQREMLAMPVSEAITQHALSTKGAICCSKQATIPEILLRMNDQPTLVIEKSQGEDRLLGIITAFDLL